MQMRVRISTREDLLLSGSADGGGGCDSVFFFVTNTHSLEYRAGILNLFPVKYHLSYETNDANPQLYYHNYITLN